PGVGGVAASMSRPPTYTGWRTTASGPVETTDRPRPTSIVAAVSLFSRKTRNSTANPATTLGGDTTQGRQGEPRCPLRLEPVWFMRSGDAAKSGSRTAIWCPIVPLGVFEVGEQEFGERGAVGGCLDLVGRGFELEEQGGEGGAGLGTIERPGEHPE